jgi:DNA modification methylase
MLGAERIGRRFAGMELEPGWCDVAVQRWEKARERRGMKGKAVLERGTR